MPNLGYEESDEIKIAQITFAFNNSKVINWLKKRGSFIQSQKWEKMDAIEKEIFGQLQAEDPSNPGELAQSAKDLLDLLQTPCTCVVTFESEEGAMRAAEYNNMIDFLNNPNPNITMAKYDHFLGVKDGLGLKEVTEPTDIIWENRSVTNKTRVIRRTISYVIILIMLFCSGCAIFTLSIKSLTLKLKYPPKDCLSEDRGFFNTEYKGTPDEKMAKIYEDAQDEVKHALEHRSRGLKESHPGYL
jgi:hypothetical protein